MTAAASGLPDVAALRRKVTSVLAGFVEEKAAAAAELRMPTEVTGCLRAFLARGGKRLRPLLCVTGWQAAGGEGVPEPVIRTAASLEMFHTFCLIHDDVMDDSGMRRGAPTLHRQLARHHEHGRSIADAERVGASCATLIGDLALAWSDELLHSAALTPAQLAAVLPLVSAMRSEVMYGQYLDVTTAGHPTTDVERALRIVRYKTAKYTVERPLHIGAALADAPDTVHEALSAYALPIGEAFQLRDDLLGVFGTPQETGKPALDDLREGKHTVLLSLALQTAGAAHREELRRLIGNRELTEPEAAHVRGILTGTGARQTVETMISRRREQALTALEHPAITPRARALLYHLADSATHRTS
ncbi:polyprenyl synthetase family protein [Streptomyces sp. NPDC058157]|uniref:polyprenyl synthetase family protein n=1 Tax=Streptomyces sp. NPDC058157 TaxID=3346360 RepID=UPI0036E8B22E